MARLPRLTVPGYPHHIIQRGTNRQRIVVDDIDRQCLLDLWQEHAVAFGVAVHAYVIMDNHFHLLATPDTAHSLPRMMQAVGRTYVRHFNLRHGRTGALWEGRYRSNLIESERYLLTCMVYIELNPVRAGMVFDPRDHRWSSHRHHIGLASDKLVKPHALYWALGDTPFGREAAYAQMVQSGLSLKEREDLTRSVMTGWALGSSQFMTKIQSDTPRRVQKDHAGRPMSNPRKRSVPN
jgi:putative transposase